LPAILEIGAGSGRLARDLLIELATLECLPQRYLILETSADLRERQRIYLQRELPDLAQRITWLDELPAALEALVIGNEVLDAMPVHLFTTRHDGVDELGVITNNDAFEFSARPATGSLLAAVSELNLAPGHTAEMNLAARAFMRTLATHLARGVVVMIDYGFPAHEYYHPQRTSGTLMCHYRQHAHDDPLHLIGLQDITAHIDFTAMAQAATGCGLDLLGYANQAQFLINCGIIEVLSAVPADNTTSYLPLAAQAQKLTSPAEMGELFKVIAFGKNYDAPLLGFTRGDKSHTL
jgi:SAM-dependent MidA family methyltransferase